MVYRDNEIDRRDMAEARQDYAVNNAMSREAAQLLTAARNSGSAGTDTASGSNNAAVAALPALEVTQGAGQSGDLPDTVQIAPNEGSSLSTSVSQDTVAGSSSTLSQSADFGSGSAGQPHTDYDQSDLAVRAGKTQGAADYYGYSTWRNLTQSIGDSLREVVPVVFGADNARVRDVNNSLLNVSQAQVTDGLNRGLLYSFQPTSNSTSLAQSSANLFNWLDRQIPRDGTPATEDRRAALLVTMAYQDAQRSSNDPSQWEEIAYDRLLRVRTTMAADVPNGRPSLPPEVRGRENDPDIAAAEHYFETSRMANTYGLVAAQLTNSAYGVYGRARSGLDGFDGSVPGEHRSGWEVAGMERGLARRIEPTIAPGQYPAGYTPLMLRLMSDASDTTDGTGGSDRVVSMPADTTTVVAVPTPDTGTATVTGLDTTVTDSDPYAQITPAPDIDGGAFSYDPYAGSGIDGQSIGAGSNTNNYDAAIVLPNYGVPFNGVDYSGAGSIFDPYTGLPTYVGSNFNYGLTTGGYDPYTGLQNSGSTNLTYGFSAPSFGSSYDFSSPSYGSTFDFSSSSYGSTTIGSSYTSPSYGSSFDFSSSSYGSGGFGFDFGSYGEG